tara:strand:- start:4513 stop:4965 length:453 start_codon:yes stop_codon:yes gene_type:complete
MSDLSAIVKTLNGLDPEAAIATLLRCCGSKRWAASLAAARPFDDQRHLLEAAELGWWALGAEDWKEAFSNHPKIGADVDALRAKYAATADWSAGEQSGVAGASEATIQALAKGNSEYDAKFGHVFLICATGKRCAACTPTPPEPASRAYG